MVDIPMLEEEAKMKALEHVTRLLEVPENLEKLDMLRMKARRQCEAMDSQLKSAMQSQLEDVKTGLELLHGCVALGKEVHSNFDQVRTLYQSVSAKAHEMDAMRPVADKRGRLAMTLEHIRHVVKVNENIRKIEIYIQEEKLLHAHKLLSELEFSRDEVMASLAKDPSANAEDLNMIKTYFGPVEEQVQNLEKLLANYMGRVIATCKSRPVIAVSCLRIVEREELLDEEYVKRSREDSFTLTNRPKRWREKLVYSQLDGTISQRIEGLQILHRGEKDYWLSLYLENMLSQFVQDVADLQESCVPCFPPRYEILYRFVKLYHTAIAERLQALYRGDDAEVGRLSDKECLQLLHWIHQRYYGREGVMSQKLRLPSKLIEMLPPLLPDDVMEECRAFFLQSTKGNIESWLRTCLEKNVEYWRSESKPDFDAKGFAYTNIPIDVFQMFRETVKEARATVGPELTYEIIEACVDQLKKLVEALFAEVNKYRAAYMKTPGTIKYFALYNIAVANSCEMFGRFMSDMITKYQDVINSVQDANPFGSTLLAKVEEVGESLQMLPDSIVTILGEVVLRDLSQVLRYLLTRDKWFVLSVRTGTICGTIEDYYQESFTHLKPDYYRSLITSLQDRIIAQYLCALNPPRLKLKEEEFAEFGRKLAEDADTYMMFFDQLEASQSPDSSTGFDSPFRIFEAIADLLTTPLDSDSLNLVSASFVKRYPDVPDQFMIALLVFRGVPGNEARTYVEDAKQAFSSSRNLQSQSKFRKIFALMSQPLPSSDNQPGTLAKLTQAVQEGAAGNDGTLSKFLSAALPNQNR